MAPLRWGILSAGLISHDFLVAISVLPKDEHDVVAIAARSLENAQKLGTMHGIRKAYGSYDELVEDPEIDVVYVGSINPQHLPLVKLSLNHGKHVLCEKPLGMNVKEVKEMISLAREKNLFLMEAIWSRFFPALLELKKRIHNGELGDVMQVVVHFGERICDVDRLKYKDLGGGTVIDLGVYCVQFAQMVFGGEKPLKIVAGGHLNEDGVDESTSSTLIYKNGRTATLVTNSRVDMANEATVYGTKKTMKLKWPFWCSTELEIVGGETVTFPLPPEKFKCNFDNGTGMNYECIEVRNCIMKGAIESELVSHEESIVIAEILESIRKQVGVEYPQD